MAGASERAFASRVDFPLHELAGRTVLDVGCGSGRYAEIAARHGAEVVAVDLSLAVDAARENLRAFLNVHLVQADVFALPLAAESFDLVYSFGVLHHTPDCERAFKALPRLLRPGGRLAIFVYAAYNKAIVYSSAVWRALTTRLPKRLLYAACFAAVPLYWLYRVPVVGHVGRALFVIPMIPAWRWRVLDTFDWYSPRYQSKHTHWEVFRWYDECGLGDVRVLPEEVTMIGTRPK
jgi:SAM-dependent methyltransferase